MRGFVPTPPSTVDQMVNLLFKENSPKPTDKVLDPGCGPGAFIEGIIRWCHRHNAPLPEILGIELDPHRADQARQKFAGVPQIQIATGDFLQDDIDGRFNYIIGNPPYVSILALSEQEKQFFRRRFKSATGRFDLYMLFLERALSLGQKGATLVFVTPEKFTYVEAGTGVRRLLASHHVSDLILLKENEFPGRTTYPAISRIKISSTTGETQIQGREGIQRLVTLPSRGESWRHLLANEQSSDLAGCRQLGDFCRRISCGIATGADAIFIKRLDEVPESLAEHAWPTISGRQLHSRTPRIQTSSVILIPYSTESRLRRLDEIGELGAYLMRPEVKEKLTTRSCTQRKPWHAFHDAPQMSDLLRPKIICKDICEDPVFWVDEEGLIVPRHSVYYIVPKNPAKLHAIAEYLNSAAVKSWLFANAQRAANGFIRIQSSVLKRLPIPEDLVRALENAEVKNASPRITHQAMSAEVLQVA